MKKIIIFIMLNSVIFLSGCGTLFYQERRGNNSNVDTKVAVLDGIGLIFLILPGVIAYAVDFTTGCIYLSPAKYSANLADNGEVIRLNKSKDVNTQINQILYDKYGANADFAIAVNGVYGLNNWYKMQQLSYSM